MTYLVDGYLLTREDISSWAQKSISKETAEIWNRANLSPFSRVFLESQAVADEVKKDFDRERVVARNEGFDLKLGLAPERIFVTSRQYFDEDSEEPVEGSSADEVRVREYLHSKGREVIIWKNFGCAYSVTNALHQEKNRCIY